MISGWVRPSVRRTRASMWASSAAISVLMCAAPRRCRWLTSQRRWPGPTGRLWRLRWRRANRTCRCGALADGSAGRPRPPRCPMRTGGGRVRHRSCRCPDPLHRAEGAEPARQVVMAGWGSGKRLAAEQATPGSTAAATWTSGWVPTPPTIECLTSTMDICHPCLCNWAEGVARTSREGDRDEQAVSPASPITLPDGACLVGAGDRSHAHTQPGGPQTCWPPPVSVGKHVAAGLSYRITPARRSRRHSFDIVQSMFATLL
jgi:hypothetical protein